MKIAINCADLDNKRIDGTRVYIKNLLFWLGKISPSDQFLLYHRKDFNPLLKPKFYENYIERKIPYKAWWTQTRLAYELLQDKPDVLWMPIQQMPYLIKKKIKTTVTIHDLAFKIFPEHFPRSDRFKLNLFTDFAVENSTKIIAVSQSTKKDILKFYPKIKPEKIEVIYHGIGKSQSSNLKAQNHNSELKIFTTNYKLPARNAAHSVAGGQTTNYILYLGAIQPRKNLITLVKAFEAIKVRENQLRLNPCLPAGRLSLSKGRKYNNGLKLVIAGPPAWQAEPILERIKNSEFSNDIILTGQISFKEIAELYKNAEIFVLPSLYEGFGMPILEAWAAGTPVIAADNSSLREVGGEAVEKFETKKSADLAGKIELLLKDKNRRMELIEKGRERLKNFSWKKCAEETLRILKN